MLGKRACVTLYFIDVLIYGLGLRELLHSESLPILSSWHNSKIIYMLLTLYILNSFLRINCFH